VELAVCKEKYVFDEVLNKKGRIAFNFEALFNPKKIFL
jgi:hypothetical protein